MIFRNLLLWMLFMCTYNMPTHTYLAVNPLPCGKISRAAFTGMIGRNLWRDLEDYVSKGGEDSTAHGRRPQHNHRLYNLWHNIVHTHFESHYRSSPYEKSSQFYPYLHIEKLGTNYSFKQEVHCTILSFFTVGN